MKKLCFLLIIITSNIYYAQDDLNISSFSSFNYGIYGGINFENTSEIGGTFLFEVKTNIISRLNMNVSLGYFRLSHLLSYQVKTYSINKIDNNVFYNAEQYNVNKYVYDVFPFALGFQYLFKTDNISPYLFLNLNYNIIDGKIERNGGVSLPYNSFEEIPDEYKNTSLHEFPNHSYGLILGVGTTLTLSTKLNLDLRYFYKYDSEISKSHQFIVGIVF